MSAVVAAILAGGHAARRQIRRQLAGHGQKTDARIGVHDLLDARGEGHRAQAKQGTSTTKDRRALPALIKMVVPRQSATQASS
jgi:hypothetical protein